MCVGSSPDEPKLLGLAHLDAVANTSVEGQHQERAGQTAHNAPRASPAEDLLPGYTTRSDPAKEAQRLIAKLEALGHKVTLTPAA